MDAAITSCYALILCGGKGTRLQKAVPGLPKPMAPVGERPFLDILIEYLQNSGIKSVVLCSGYKAGYIREYYAKHEFSIQIQLSYEAEPLGTAGAIKNAENIIKGDTFIVLNGDSFSRVDLEKMLDQHIHSKAEVTVALSALGDASDFGTVELDAKSKVVRFSEKNPKGAPGLVNAGIYIFNRQVLSLIPKNKPYSLEYDLFPMLNQMYGFISGQEFIDIGTEERYNTVRNSFKDIP